MIGPKTETREDISDALNVGNIVFFHGLQLDEPLVAAVFTLGPGDLQFTIIIRY